MKRRIVFDASAKFQGMSLSSEPLPGPKLQADMLSILARFRKELVALVGGVSPESGRLTTTQISMDEFGARKKTSTNSRDTCLCAVCRAETSG